MGDVDLDPVSGIDELRQAVSRTAIWVVAGLVRRGPTQRGVGEGRGDERRREEEESEENRNERDGEGEGRGSDHHVIEPEGEEREHF